MLWWCFFVSLDKTVARIAFQQNKLQLAVGTASKLKSPPIKFWRSRRFCNWIFRLQRTSGAGYNGTLRIQRVKTASRDLRAP